MSVALKNVPYLVLDRTTREVIDSNDAFRRAKRELFGFMRLSAVSEDALAECNKVLDKAEQDGSLFETTTLYGRRYLVSVNIDEQFYHVIFFRLKNDEVMYSVVMKSIAQRQKAEADAEKEAERRAFAQRRSVKLAAALANRWLQIISGTVLVISLTSKLFEYIYRFTTDKEVSAVNKAIEITVEKAVQREYANLARYQYSMNQVVGAVQSVAKTNEKMASENQKVLRELKLKLAAIDSFRNTKAIVLDADSTLQIPKTP